MAEVTKGSKTAKEQAAEVIIEELRKFLTGFAGRYWYVSPEIVETLIIDWKVLNNLPSEVSELLKCADPEVLELAGIESKKHVVWPNWCVFIEGISGFFGECLNVITEHNQETEEMRLMLQKSVEDAIDEIMSDIGKKVDRPLKEFEHNKKFINVEYVDKEIIAKYKSEFDENFSKEVWEAWEYFFGRHFAKLCEAKNLGIAFYEMYEARLRIVFAINE